MPRRLLALLAASTLVPLAGCGDSGSSSSGPGADPAKVVPADTPVYVEAVVRPDGDVGDGARDALKKLLRTDDPGAKVAGLANKLLAKEGMSWDEVSGWLGKRLGAFLAGVKDGKPVVAVVLDVTDKDKAAKTLDKLLAKDHKGAVRKEDYKGVSLNRDDESAFAAFDDYAVVGQIDAVKKVVDTSQGRRPLSDVADYAAVRTAVKADDALGVVYAKPQELLDIVEQAIPAQESSTDGAAHPFGGNTTQLLTLARQFVAKLGRAVGASLHADGDVVRIDGAGIGASGQANPAAADAVAALPADAWLALGFGDIGATASKVLSYFEQFSGAGTMPSGTPDVAGALKAFEAKTQIDLKRDFFSWMGDGAIYARGRGLADIGVVASIKTKDAAKSRRAVGLLRRAIENAGGKVKDATVAGYDTAIQIRLSDAVPISLYVAANAERFSAGVNPRALTDVLAPTKTFGESPSYDAATKALGGDLRPVFVLDFPTVVGLLEGLGLGNNAGFAKVKPYLDALGTLSAGTARDGDVARFALALSLR